MKVEQKYRNAVEEMSKLKQDLASVKETKDFECNQTKKSMERSLATANSLINQLSGNSCIPQ
jgi:cell division septum initiation protein DivIVA